MSYLTTLPRLPAISQDGCDAIRAAHIRSIKRTKAYKLAKESERIFWRAELTLILKPLSEGWPAPKGAVINFFNAAARAINAGKLSQEDTAMMAAWLDEARPSLSE